MKNRKFRLILSAGVSLAIVPTMIAASCGSKAATNENTNDETAGDSSNTNADGGNDNTNPSEPTTPETSGDKDSTPTPKPVDPVTPSEGSGEKENPTTPATGETGKETKPTNPEDNAVTELNKVKTQAKKDIDALAKLSVEVKNELKKQVESAATRENIQTLVDNAKAVDAVVMPLVQQITTSKEVKAKSDSVSGDVKTTFEAELTKAEGLLTKNNLLKAAATTKDELTKVTAALKTSTDKLNESISLIAKHSSVVAELETKLGDSDTSVKTLVDELKSNLLEKVQSYKTYSAENAAKAVEVKDLLDKADVLQTLVSESLALRTSYTRNYYNASNKAEFDKALDKALVLYPEYNFKNTELANAAKYTEANNSLYWAPARAKDDYKLLNYVKEQEGKVVVEETADNQVTSTLAALKSLEAKLNETKTALNGESRKDSQAYFKNPFNYTVSWSGFMPHIKIDNLPGYWVDLKNTDDKDKANGLYEKTAFKNTTKIDEKEQSLITPLKAWFDNKNNWKDLSSSLTKKLGSENFNNVKLGDPTFSFKYVVFDKGVYIFTQATFELTAQDNTTWSKEDGVKNTITIELSDLRNASHNNGTEPSDVGWNYFTKNLGSNDQKIAWDIMAKFVEYNGPAIPLDASMLNNSNLGTGLTDQKTIFNTQNVPADFNKSFKDWFLTYLDNSDQNKLKNVLTHYLKRYDARFNLSNGAVVAYPFDRNNVKNIGYNSKDELRNNFSLQQIQGDHEAVYLPIQVSSVKRWIATYFIRIPLTKFVKPVAKLEAAQSAPASEAAA
ncbi:hypothetical protein ACJA23_01650 [Mycoplasma corogypsi]|uniref:GA module-containing protein n=1 Tax=Mycoplasma corogypsi TaxID=2106 RepID=UPI003872D39B